VTAPEAVAVGPGEGVGAGIEDVLAELADLVTAARPVPLSSSVMVNRDEVLGLVDEVAVRLPEEIRAARRMLREREAFLAGVQREADEILEAARQRAERMVSKTELVRMAEATARRAVDSAEAESRRLRHEAEDWCDAQLASLESALEGAMRSVRAGRARLTGPAPTPEPAPGDDTPAPVFDQDSEEP
jgi:cell division septum initiation protein DivIVA